MNMNNNPLVDELAALLGGLEDTGAEHLLWVDHAGDVHLTVVDGPDIPGDRARLLYAPFEGGVGCVGEDAAGDPELVGELLASLIGQWAAARNAPPGTLMVDLDDPESGPDWTLTEVATVDDELLARLSRATSH
jgi:hypothetical protein